MSEWVKLTQDKDLRYVNLYLRVEDSHSFTIGKRCDHEINMSLFRQPTTVSTTELANIPWVRALIETARKAQEHLQQESDTGGSIGDAINAQKLHVALEPFAEAAYE